METKTLAHRIAVYAFGICGALIIISFIMLVIIRGDNKYETPKWQLEAILTPAIMAAIAFLCSVVSAAVDGILVAWDQERVANKLLKEVFTRGIYLPPNMVSGDWWRLDNYKDRRFYVTSTGPNEAILAIDRPYVAGMLGMNPFVPQPEHTMLLERVKA